METKLEIFRLHFTEPLHISNARNDYNSSERVIFSDTLHAAIMDTWAILGKQEWIKPEPEFAISNLFPFTKKDDEMVYFFRKPYKYKNNRDKNKSADAVGEAKKNKNVQYIDSQYFENLLNGKYDPLTEHIRGQFLSRIEIKADFISTNVIPRIRWHRNEAEDTEIFYMERLYFAKDSGLYFIFIGDSEMKKRVTVALNYLAENGLGTDRTVGHGRFEYTEDSFLLNLPAKSDYSINLSLFCPESQTELNEMLDTASGYNFIRRGGWMGEPYNSYRKRSVHMFTEGSVFRQSCEGMFTKGKTVDLKPEGTPVKIGHPVYRVGKSIFMPVII